MTLARWPLMLVLVALAVAVLLRFAPNVAVPFQWPMVGGFAFAIGWVVATALFALYVANFANYSNTYGALGGVVVLMLWFYLTAVMLLLAAELTSLLAKDHAPEHIAARQREIGGAGAGRTPLWSGSPIARWSSSRCRASSPSAPHRRRRTPSRCCWSSRA